MRQAIITGISALSLGTFKVSSELPWVASGELLYMKNPKTFYVDEPDSAQSNLINTLCGGNVPNVANKTTTISVWVSTDAKQKPSNYDSLVASIQGLKDLTTLGAVRSRECDVNTTFEADRLVTEFVFRFTEIVIS